LPLCFRFLLGLCIPIQDRELQDYARLQRFVAVQIAEISHKKVFPGITVDLFCYGFRRIALSGLVRCIIGLYCFCLEIIERCLIVRVIREEQQKFLTRRLKRAVVQVIQAILKMFPRFTIDELLEALYLRLALRIIRTEAMHNVPGEQGVPQLSFVFVLYRARAVPLGKWPESLVFL